MLVGRAKGDHRMRTDVEERIGNTIAAPGHGFLDSWERVVAAAREGSTKRIYWKHDHSPGDSLDVLVVATDARQRPRDTHKARPALLGGVYSAPMAMVRFLELTLLLPATPITRIDRPGIVRFSSDSQASWGTARVSESEIPMAGGKATLVVELDPSKDPSEYYAIVAVPSTLGIAQTEDILADYKGNLIHGQQAGGASKPQLMAIPFRGLSRLSLLLEAVQPGTSPGVVAVRHIERPDEEAIVAIPEVRVRTLAAHD
jgi:hypothetical protein